MSGQILTIFFTLLLISCFSEGKITLLYREQKLESIKSEQIVFVLNKKFERTKYTNQRNQLIFDSYWCFNNDTLWMFPANEKIEIDSVEPMLFAILKNLEVYDLRKPKDQYSLCNHLIGNSEIIKGSNNYIVQHLLLDYGDFEGPNNDHILFECNFEIDEKGHLISISKHENLNDMYRFCKSIAN